MLGRCWIFICEFSLQSIRLQLIESLLEMASLEAWLSRSHSYGNWKKRLRSAKLIKTKTKIQCWSVGGGQ